MSAESTVNIITSILTTLAVIFTLGYTMIINYKNKKELEEEKQKREIQQKELEENQKKREIQQSYSEINKLLANVWQKFEHFNVEKFNYTFENHPTSYNKQWNAQINKHLSKYIFEVKNTLLPYNVPHNLPLEHTCMQCEKNFTTSEWNKIFLKNEINEVKVIWEVWFRISLVQINYYEFKILSGTCPNCIWTKINLKK